jgi:nucleoside-diphosphate-sugar epimerase
VSKRVLIVGCGDIGQSLGLQLAAVGWQVTGLRRNGTLPAPLQTINADVTKMDSLQALSGISFDYVVVTLTPGGFTDDLYRQIYVEGLRNLLDVLSPASHWLWVSSTSVYHQANDQWVDEDSDTLPTTFSGMRLLEAEQQLVEYGLAHSVVRFAGIYGPGRRRLIEQVQAGKGCIQTPNLYTNRIHRDDCVGLLAHLLSMADRGQQLASCYIGVDNEPVTMWQLKSWLAQQLDMSPSALTEQAMPRRNSKRCSNQRLLATGYQLQYPSYREGYGALLDQ